MRSQSWREASELAVLPVSKLRGDVLGIGVVAIQLAVEHPVAGRRESGGPSPPEIDELFAGDLTFDDTLPFLSLAERLEGLRLIDPVPPELDPILVGSTDLNPFRHSDIPDTFSCRRVCHCAKKCEELGQCRSKYVIWLERVKGIEPSS